MVFSYHKSRIFATVSVGYFLPKRSPTQACGPCQERLGPVPGDKRSRRGGGGRPNRKCSRGESLGAQGKALPIIPKNPDLCLGAVAEEEVRRREGLFSKHDAAQRAHAINPAAKRHSLMDNKNLTTRRKRNHDFRLSRKKARACGSKNSMLLLPRIHRASTCCCGPASGMESLVTWMTWGIRSWLPS